MAAKQLNILLVIIILTLLGALGCFILFPSEIGKPTGFLYKPATTQTEISFEDLNAARPNVMCFGQEDSYVINTKEEYDRLYQEAVVRGNCKGYTPPIIDFSKRTLLGKHASGVCQVAFFRKAYRDDTTKKIVYAITVVEGGSCEMAVHSMNWITIPKIPEMYHVEFNISRL